MGIEGKKVEQMHSQCVTVAEPAPPFGPVTLVWQPDAVVAVVRSTSRLTVSPLEPMVLERTSPPERVTLRMAEFPFEPVAVAVPVWVCMAKFLFSDETVGLEVDQFVAAERSCAFS